MNPGPSEGASRERLREENQRLRLTLQQLRGRLEEPEEIIRAIRSGEVDAFVVNATAGEQIYSLRSADLLYRAMVDQMKEGAVALDASGLVLYCNGHFAHLIRGEREALVGTSIFSFVPPESASFFELLRQPSGEAMVRRELSLRASDGSPVPVFATMNRMRVEEQEVFCLIVTDLTERRFREELMAQSQRKDDFLAMLAHELRNPIAPIRTAAQIIHFRAPADPSLQWAREVIERQVNQLTRLVDDLLDISRITRGKIRLEREAVDLGQAVSRSIEMARPLIDARRHRLATELPPRPLRVMADGARVSQVISNLLNNAAKFTPEGGQIWLTVGAEERSAQVLVRDSGIGISAEMLPRIFDLFTQADSTMERAQGGLGIGLTLVRSLVEIQGGSVEARSNGPGQGSEFLVRLPLLPESWQEPPPAPEPPRPEIGGPARRILVLDDNADASESLTVLLQTMGHEVRAVSNGQQALKEAVAFRPDVMFVDIAMPRMNGYEVARRIRKTAELKSVLLVALTGYGQAEDRRRSLAAGFDEHLVKPAPLEQLLGLLERRGPAPPLRAP